MPLSIVNAHFHTSIHSRENTKNTRGINFESLYKQSRIIYFEKKKKKRKEKERKTFIP